MNTRITSIAACTLIAGCAAFASADTVNMTYNTVTRADGTISGSNYARVKLDTTSHIAGHMKHTINGGSNAGEFRTFCIELGEFANGGASDYEIVDLTSAPNPGLPGSYDSTEAANVVTVISRAIKLGWINSSLQADTSQTDYGLRMAAIQGMVWEALGLGTASSTDTTIQGYITSLGDSMYDDATINANMTQRLRAAVSTGEQDMLFVVPLPTSVFAGLGMLGGLAGIRSIRRRQA